MSLDQRSNKELKSGLAGGEYDSRKKAFVEEILRRRRHAKDGWRSRNYVWLTALFAALSVGTAAIRRFWRKAD